jgi:hypothetical protein
MAIDSGTTFYTIVPDVGHTSLVHGEHFILVPDQNCAHNVRLTIDTCGGDFPVLRWLDRSREFVALTDDFLIEGVATGLIWNEDEQAFVIDGQAVNIHGFEWLVVGESTTVGKGTARLLFVDYTQGAVTCDLTDARQFSSLLIHNAGTGSVVVRSDTIAANAAIYSKGVLVETDIVLTAGETVQFACFEEDVYTLIVWGQDSLPSVFGAVDTFLGLTDTPSAYDDYGYKALRVNLAEDEVEFSPGVNDQTTQETVFITDAILKLGPLSGPYSIAKRDGESYLVISAGTGLNSGAHHQLHGGDAGTPSNDWDFRTGTTSQMYFDYSFKTFNFRDNKLVGTDGFTINLQKWPLGPGAVGQVIVMGADGQLVYGGGAVGVMDTIIAAASDEYTPISVSGGVPHTTFRAPFPLALAYIRIELTTAPDGDKFEVDIHMNGVTLFSTLLTIDIGEDTSFTAAIPAVLDVFAVPDNAKFEVYVTQTGTTVAGTGLKTSVTGVKTA